MFKKEPLEGVLNGIIKITPDFIEIDKQNYDIKEITNLQIEMTNFSGKLQSKLNYPGPWRSSGIGNNISFQSDGIIVAKTFSIQTEKDFETLKKLRKKLMDTVGNNLK